MYGNSAMNEVISSYFEESDKGLRQRRAQGGGNSGSKVSLPPLHPQAEDSGASGSGGVSIMHPSVSRTAQDSGMSPTINRSLNSDVLMSITEERFEQLLQENERLEKKVRSLQDQLAITTAKKQAFKASAKKLEKDLEHRESQLETLQSDTELARTEHASLQQASNEAMKMMREMRNTHLQEIRLLQKGLQARTDDKVRNRVNEMADLVDKLGRAIVQRDEALKENSKLSSQLNQAKSEIRNLQMERSKILSQNKKLSKQFEGMRSRAEKLMAPPKESAMSAGAEDLSDDEFEAELAAFERRYMVLDEGAKGLDHFVEQLNKDNERLEAQQAEAKREATSLRRMVSHWQTLANYKEKRLQEVTDEVTRMQQAHMRLQRAVEGKQKEIEAQIQAERTNFLERLNTLQAEKDTAVSAAQDKQQGYQTLNDKLNDELQRQYELTSGLQGPPSPKKSETSAASPTSASPVAQAPAGPASHIASPSNAIPEPTPAPVPAVEEAAPPSTEQPMASEHIEPEPAAQDPAPAEPVADAPAEATAAQGDGEEGADADEWDGEPACIEEQVTQVKTGEMISLSIWRTGEADMELRGTETSSNTHFAIPLTEDILVDLDEEDPWPGLFDLVGIVPGPPREMRLGIALERREVVLEPANVSILTTIYQYDARRFWISGYELENQRLVNLLLGPELVTPTLAVAIDDAGEDRGQLLAALLSNLCLHEMAPATEGDFPTLKLAVKG
mmetsp:Transcript_4811/g.11749  ORF Transcript_4811/g.11749 Transcript_4811/m.11749 type:complete len:732 (-) Transcript_4811:182-2377(-)